MSAMPHLRPFDDISPVTDQPPRHRHLVDARAKEPEGCDTTNNTSAWLLDPLENRCTVPTISLAPPAEHWPSTARQHEAQSGLGERERHLSFADHPDGSYRNSTLDTSPSSHRRRRTSDLIKQRNNDSAEERRCSKRPYSHRCDRPIHIDERTRHHNLDDSSSARSSSDDSYRGYEARSRGRRRHYRSGSSTPPPPPPRSQQQSDHHTPSPKPILSR